MPDYKPLTDKEILRQEFAPSSPRGMTHNEMYCLLLTQCRRANELAAAMSAWSEGRKEYGLPSYSKHDAAIRALAAYLGESQWEEKV